MFKVTSIPRSIGFRCISKAAEKASPVESFKVENDVNGMTVVSIQPRYHTISKVAAVFNAGSRFEDYESRGMNHLLRRCVGLSSGGYSAVSVTRHFQQMGSQLRCLGTRENLAYVVDFSYDLMDKIVELLAHATTRQTFYHWELTQSAKALMKTDIQYVNRRDFDTLCSELLHKAAFRDNLGNSLFANEYRLGDWNIDIIERFLDLTFTANKSMLVGLSVDHEKLVRHAEDFKIRPLKDTSIPKSIFRGGEYRKELPLNFCTVSIVWEAPGFNNIKDGLAASILSDAIDNGANLRIKWNNGELELMKRAVKDPKINESCVANSTYTSYSDTGLLGFTLSGCPKVQNEAIRGLHSFFRNIGKNGVATHDFDIAKKAFIMKLWMRSETSDGLMENVIAQSTSTGEILSIDRLIDLANSITVDDVNKVAKSVLSNPKRAMAAVGDLSTVPYLHDLEC